MNSFDSSRTSLRRQMHRTRLLGRQGGGPGAGDHARQSDVYRYPFQGKTSLPLSACLSLTRFHITFQDVIYAIRDTAFVTAEGPVILSFENHCR